MKLKKNSGDVLNDTSCWHPNKKWENSIFKPDCWIVLHNKAF